MTASQSWGRVYSHGGRVGAVHRSAWAIAAICLFAGPARAADLVVTADTTLPPGSYSFGACTVGAGATLVVETDGTGLASALSCDGLTVAAGAQIVAGAGFAAGEGPATGATGGAGIGDGAGDQGGVGGYTGGLLIAGSGGAEGAGGGALVITVAGSLELHGALRANGVGDGGGGGLDIVAADLAGAGTIEARGGSGGGGGGRVEITGALDTDISLSAAGGGGGGAGIIVRRPAPGAAATWRIDGGGAATRIGAATLGADSLAVSGGADVRVAEGAVITLGGITIEAATLTSAGALDLGAAVVGDGGTLTLDAPATATSLVVAAGGLITHTKGSTGIDLTVSGDAVVSGEIDASGRGFGAGDGPAAGPDGAYRVGAAGGGHAGRGGAGAGNNGGASASGAAGDPLAPALAGSGGGSSGNFSGGAGGGVIRLSVGGALDLDGVIAADGRTGAWSSTNYAGGGGAGGAIHLSAADIPPLGGQIHAHGGAGGDTNRAHGGGGGGGRIRVDLAGGSLGALVEARGGSGQVGGGAGTVIIDDGVAALTIAGAAIENGGTPLDPMTVGALTAYEGARLTYSAADPLVVLGLAHISHSTHLLLDGSIHAGRVLLDGSAWVTHTPGGSGLEIVATADLSVGPQVLIDVSGCGYDSGEGPGGGGFGAASRKGGAGGAHGGNGGDATGNNADMIGPVGYDSLTVPSLPGSGGAGTADGGHKGGRGGGVVVLEAGGDLLLDGTVRANGRDGVDDNYYRATGGGAGGTVRLRGARVIGYGFVQANGGQGMNAWYADGGGGGGGRVAVRGDVVSGVRLEARGGWGSAQHGGAGTIAVLDGAGDILSVEASNGGYYGAFTRLPGDTWSAGALYSLSSARLHLLAGADVSVAGPVTLEEGSDLRLDGILRCGSLSMAAGTRLDHTAGVDGFHLVSAGDVTVAETASIDASGRGFSSDGGPGTGVAGGSRIGGGGGAHGGDGARGAGGHGAGAGGPSYGSALVPVTLGSGGASSGDYAGGAGGGRIRIEAAGTVLVEGEIRADGRSGSSQSYYYAGGGGAGGTIDITAAAVVGGGLLSAAGGNGPSAWYAEGGPGSGGRIRVDSPIIEVTHQTPGGVADHGAGAGGTWYHPHQGALTGAAGAASPLAHTPLPAGAYALTSLVARDHVYLSLGPDVDVALTGSLQVGSGALLEVANPLSARTALIEDSGTVAVYPELETFHLQVAGDLMVHPGGRLTGDARGFTAGPGAGGHGGSRIGGGGGGHGCLGGTGKGGNGTSEGGAAYGDPAAPTRAGSAGGDGCDDLVGGAGGGRVRVSVHGTATIDGTITADGGGSRKTNYYCATGAGSGGTIDLAAGTLAGSGVVRAGGGSASSDAWYAKGGGGGGGRVRIRAASGALETEPTAPGGPGGSSNPGCDGSVVIGALPGAVTDLAASPGPTEGTLALTWTSPTGAAADHLVAIRVLDVAVTGATWPDAAPAATLPAVPEGEAQAYDLTGLVAGQPVHLALRLLTADGAAGAVSNSVEATPTGDDVPPAAVADLAAAGADGATDLSWTAPTDVGSGVASLELRTAPLAAGPFDWPTAAPLAEQPPVASPGVAQSLAVTSLPPDTSVRVGLRSTDSAGNVSALSNLAVIDGVAPVVSLSAPAGGATLSAPVHVTGTATDDVGVVALTLTVDGEPAGDGTPGVAGAFSFLWDPATVPPGPHTLAITARDAFGNEAAASVEVVTDPATPVPPVILAPPDGLKTSLPTTDVAGSLPPATAATLLIDGVPSDAEATLTTARQLTVSATAGPSMAQGCVTSGETLTLGDTSSPLTNLALDKTATASATYNNSFPPSEVVDGVLENGTQQTGYWIAPNHTAAHVTVDLHAAYTLTRIELVNSRNANYKERSTADFRVELSTDGVQWTEVAAGTLPEDEILIPTVITLDPMVTARFVRFHADSWYGNGAGLSELRAFGIPNVTSCSVVTGPLALPGAEAFTTIEPLGSSGDGTFTTRFATSDFALQDTFAAPAVDDAAWQASEGVAPGDGLAIEGIDQWGARYLVSREAFSRAEHPEVRFTLQPNAGRTMVGLRRPGDGTSYTHLAHAIYFENGSLEYWADGSHKWSYTTYETESVHEVRFLIAPGSLTITEYRPAGQTAWKRVYTSTADMGPGFQPMVTVRDGHPNLHEISVGGHDWRPLSELAGAPTTGTLWVRTDLARPGVAVTSPVLTGVRVTWQGTGGDPGPAAFRFEDVPLPEGDHVITVTATDAAGTVSPPSAPVAVHVDSLAPAPIGDLAAVKGEQQGEVVLTWTAPGDDADDGTAAAYDVRWSGEELDEAVWASGTAVPMSAPQAAGVTETLVVGGLTAGKRYWFGVRAHDDLDNLSALSNVATELGRDTTPPSLSITDPDGGTHHHETVAVTVNTFDNVAVTGVALLVGDTEIDSATEAPWELSWDTTAWPDGEHVITVVSSDADANTRSVSMVLTADNTPPEVSIAAVPGVAGAGVTLDVTATDNLTAPGDLVVLDQAGFGAPWLLTDPGAHEITITATDRAGNQAQASAAFGIDLEGPAAVTDLAAAAPAGEPDAAAISFTAPADAQSAVASYEVRAAPLADLQAVLSGDGADGDLVVADPTTLDPARTALTGVVAAGDTALPVASAAGFTAGDEVLLHAARCDLDALGLAGATTWSAGVPLRVASTAAGVLTLAAPVGAAFDGERCSVSVQRVPNYASVTVQAGGRLSGPAWDGATGGLLALRVAGMLQVDPGGAIDMSGAGFRGHAPECIRNVDGHQGEGALRQTAQQDRRPALGGGGGGTGNTVSGTGPDSAGGGGGGHGTPGSPGTDHNGRLAGLGGVVQAHGLLFGGGGGQGGADEDGGSPGGGGAGGGAILVAANALVSRGAIQADGAPGSPGCHDCGECGGKSCGMGGGGGGAGGAIRLTAAGVLDVEQVLARGGPGGANNGCGGVGGTGGAGIIHLHGPGAAGTSDPPAVSSAPPAFDWASATPVAGVPAPVTPGSEVDFTTSPFEAGQTWVFAMRSADAAGNLSPLSNLAVRDLAPPSIAFAAPTDGATLSGPTLLVATADDDGGVVSVRFEADGVLLGETTAPPWQLPWTDPTPGPHTLRAVATDAAGQTASAEIAVEVALAPPAAPAITAPKNGTLQSLATTAVAGTAEAGTQVTISVSGEPAAVADTLQATRISLDAAQPGTLSAGCALVEAGLVISGDAPDSATDLARTDRQAIAVGGTSPAHAIDGVADDPDAAWTVSAAQGEGLTWLGRVALVRPEVAGTIELVLPGGDGQRTYNLRVRSSADGERWATWLDGSGGDEDYQGVVSLTRDPVVLRYVDVWISGSPAAAQGRVLEVRVHGPADPLVCFAESGVAPAPGALHLADPLAEGTGDLSDLLVATSGPIFPTTFGDLGGWVSALATLEADDTVALAGTGTWGSSYLFTEAPWDRALIDRVDLRVAGDGRVMVGLKVPGPDVGYPAMAHAVYIRDGEIRLYELGSHVDTVGSLAAGALLDTRFEVTAEVVRTWIRWPGDPNYSLVRTSTLQSGPDFQAGATVDHGTFTVQPPVVHGTRWRDPVAATVEGAPTEHLRWRSTLRRRAPGDPSPTLAGWTAWVSNGATGGVGDGLFFAPSVALTEGLNPITAVASDARGDSPASAAVTVTVDTGPPGAPQDLAAVPLGGGAVVLSWLVPDGEVPVAYTIYRSDAAITDVTGLTPIATGVPSTSFGDLPPSGGSWHYVVVAVDAAGNSGPPSEGAQAIPDDEGPTAGLAFDPVGPVVGPGDLVLTLTSSEPLGEVPTLTVHLPGDAGLLTPTLTGETDRIHTATVEVLPSWPSGPLAFTWQGRDLAGNYGSVLTGDPTLSIDTVGPSAAIVIEPASPLRAGNAVVTVTLSEAPADAPLLSLTPASGDPIEVALAGSATTWTGSLAITEATGDGLATFSYAAADASGNPGTTITSGAIIEINAQPPAPPTALAAVKHPAGWFDLTWQPTEDPDPLTFRLYRAQGGSIDGAEGIGAPTDPKATDLPPAAGPWTYAVSAVDAAGNESLPSEPVTVQADPPPPEDVTDLHATGVGEQHVSIAWTGSANSSGLLAGYRVYRNGAMVASLPQDATTFTASGLPAASAITMRVSAFDTKNHESLGAEITVWTLMDNPADVVALGHDESVEILWSPVPPSAALLHYAVYAGPQPIADVTGLEPVAINPGGTAVTIGGLENGVPWHVAVVSVNRSGFHQPLVASVSATPGDDAPPLPPDGLSITGVTETTLEIAWDPSANTSGDLAGYRIYADDDEAVSLGPDATTATIDGLLPKAAVSVGVSAFDLLGNESAPTEITGYTRMPHPAGLALTPHDRRLDLTFEPPAPLAHVAAYRVYVLAAAFTSVEGRLPVLELPPTATSASLGDLANGTTWHVAVTTVNPSGDEDPAVTTVAGTPFDDAAPPDSKWLVVSGSHETSLDLAWQAPADPDGDLAALNLYADDTLLASLAKDATTTTATGLLEASKVALRLRSVDAAGNESAGATVNGYTLMPNPSDVAITEALHERLRVGFTPPAPTSNVKHFAIYAQSQAFTSVEGLSPVRTVSASSSSALITGLQNGVQVHLAVTTVNKSGGERPEVISVVGTPTEDTVGPAIGALTYAGQPLPDGGTITDDGKLAIDAIDPMGVDWVRVLVDGNTAGTDQSPSGGFGVHIAVDDLTEGPHLLTVQSADTLGNQSSHQQTVVVQHAPPAAPAITQPADGHLTSDSKLLVKGTARPNTSATLSVGGVAKATVPVDGAGGFSAVVVLDSGTNVITATATGIGGEGEPSAPVSVLLDDTVPEPPKALTAKPGEGGTVALQWYDDGQVPPSGLAAYRVYRHPEPFDDVGAATLAGTVTAGNGLSLTDVPPADGTWIYRVTVVTGSGVESAPSAPASATSDATPPVATAIEWIPKGAYLDPRFGVGPITVRVTFSEPLGTSPFLSLVPDGGAPKTIALIPDTDTVYSGSVTIDASTPSGTALAVLSARDAVLNRGTEVQSGGSIELDTDAPSAASLVLSPASPIKNDPDAPATVTVTLTLSEALPEGEAPVLRRRLATSHPDPEEIALVASGPLTWVGGFILYDDAGVAPETLVFDYHAVDDLGNESTTIEGPASAEVYQGDLPPLSAPLGLTATSLPAGEVRLTWAEVPGAAEYEVLREPPGGVLAPIGRTTDLAWQEDPGADGTWRYAVATVRQHQALETVSDPTAPLGVVSDRTPPPGAEDLALSLTPGGIRLVWTPPAPSEPVTWRIYRSAIEPLTSIDGLEPLVAGLEQTNVIDPTPSDTEHTYVVVAEDAAGNPSAPSPSQYLNAGLLPVPTLSVLDEGDGTTVSWTHQSPSVVAFGITIDGLDAGGSPTVDHSFVDPLPATAATVYGVTAIDDAGVWSLERTITRPAIGVALASGESLRRGLVDVLDLVVTSDTAISDATISVTLGDDTFSAPHVDLVAGTSPVEVTVGADPGLTSAEAASAEVRIDPEPGATVRVRRPLVVPTAPDVYTLDVLAKSFVSGATGTVQLRLHNNGDATVEIVTARKSGQLPSDEVRFELEDPDGNRIATAALHHGSGEGVIGLGDGTVVARIPPGGSYTSAPTVIPLPAETPDLVKVRLRVDQVHHDVSKAGHIALPGQSAATEVSLVPPPYAAEVTSAAPAVSTGEPVLIEGVATFAGGEPAAGVLVDLFVSVAGFERRFSLVTAADGAFSQLFEPLPGEGGLYDAWATYPGLAEKSVEASFAIQRLAVDPAALDVVLAANYPKTVTVTAKAPPGTVATNLRLETTELLPTGLTIEPAGPLTLTGPGAVGLELTLAATGQAPTAGSTVLALVSDERTWAEIPLSWQVAKAEPLLAAQPTVVVTGVARGATVTETVRLTNKGLIPLNDPSISLVTPGGSPAPPWIFLASPAEPGDLAVGGVHQASIVCAPDQSVPITGAVPHAFLLRVASGGDVIGDVPVQVHIDDSGVGSVLFKVLDIYTGSLDPSGNLVEGLAGAKVELTKTFGTAHEVTLKTDATGEVLFTGVPTGTYRFRVSRGGHEAQDGTLSIKPGVTATREVFLPSELVTFEWEVTETTIEDSYEVVLKATFETDVPAAVVVAEPPSTPMPDLAPGEVFYGEYTLTNYGLIRADDVSVALPSGNGKYKFELLVDPPKSIDSHQQVTIPYRITRLAEIADASGGGGCVEGHVAKHCYVFICLAGIPIGACTNRAWTGKKTSGCGGDINPSGDHGPGGGIGLAGSPASGSPGCDPCKNNKSEAAKECCQDSQSEETGSSVQIVTGRYTDSVTDLTLGVLGHDLELTRDFDGGWRFPWLEDALDVQGDVLTWRAAAYRPADEAKTLYLDTDETARIVPIDGGWRHVDRAGFAREFTAGGDLVSVADRAGRKVVLQREGGQVTAILDHHGEVALSFEYTGGRLARATTADGRECTYTWEDGRLVEVVDPTGGVTTYGYDDAGRLVTKHLPTGRQLTITYGNKGQVASVLDQAGVGFYFDYGYNSTTQLSYAATLHTDGRIHERWFDRHGALAKELMDGEPVLSLAPLEHLVTDDDGNVLGSVHADGSKASTYEYDDGLLMRLVDARGLDWRFEYDENGQITRQVKGFGYTNAQETTWTYDALGRVQELREHGATEADDAVWTYGYDDAGNITSVTGPDEHTYAYTAGGTRQATSATYDGGDTWEVTRDAAGRITSRQVTPEGGEPILLETRTHGTWTGAAGAVAGRQETVLDPEGRQTIYRYDTLDRLVSVTDHWGRVASRSYDAQGRVVSETDGAGVTTTWTYETLSGGVQRTIERVGDEVVSIRDDDAYGRIKRTVRQGVETVWFYDGQGTLPVEVAGPGLRILFDRDALGNAVKVQYLYDDGGGWVEQRTFDGRLPASLTRSTGGSASAGWSIGGERVRFQKGDGPAQLWNRSAWDALTSIVDERGITAIDFGSDHRGNVTRRAFPDGGALDYTVGREGKVTSATWQDGTSVDWTYDYGSRLTASAARLPGSTEPDDVAGYAYDGYGRLTLAQSAEATISMAWDDFERTRTVTVDFGPFAKTWIERTDPRGRVVETTLPSGEAVTWSRRADGTLSGVSVPGLGEVTIERPEPFVDRVALGSVAVTTTRKAMGLPVSVHATSGGSDVARLDYSLSGPRITGISTELGDHTYEHTADDRLVAATYPTLPAETFSYDAAGHRIEGGPFGDAEWTVNVAGQVEAIGDAASFTWDAHGRMASRTIGEETLTFEYGPRDRLRTVKNGAGEVMATYGYDALGRRVRKTVDGVTTYFLHSDEGLLAEYSASGEELRRYTWRPDTPLQAAPISVHTADAGYVVVPNHQGAPVALLDADGAVAWRAEYEAYGRAHVQGVVTLPIRGSGQYHDAETGLHYNTWRYYDPVLGRYLRRDPLMEVGSGANLYEFANGSPIMQVDRLGLISGGGCAKRGGYNGVGGTLKGCGKGEVKDCCKKEEGKPPRLIRFGQACASVSGKGEGGLGWGYESDKVSAVAKLVTGSGEVSCEACTGCGSLGGGHKRCCGELCANASQAEVDVGDFSSGGNLGSLCKKGCTDGSSEVSVNGPSADASYTDSGFESDFDGTTEWGYNYEKEFK